MKKLLLTLGTLASFIGPIVTVVACGSPEKYITDEGIKTTTDKAPETTTGEAPEITTGEAPETTTDKAPETTTDKAPEILPNEGAEAGSSESTKTPNREGVGSIVVDPVVDQSPLVETSERPTNTETHEAEVAATAHNGTQANNVDGEDLTRPFIDIADSQDENTVYESSGVITQVFTGNMPLTSTNMHLKDFNADAKNFDFNDFTSLSIHVKNETSGYSTSFNNYTFQFNSIGQKVKSQRFYIQRPDLHEQDYLKLTLTKNGVLEIEKQNTKMDENYNYHDLNIPFDGKEGFIIDGITIKKRVTPYWASLIPTKVTPVQFKWNADECHSIADIIKQMDSQLHFKFQKKLEKMTPLEFANYIVNLTINNGGGEWDFKVNYKGESDDVSLNPAPVLNRFIKALDGDANPSNENGMRFKAISDKTQLAASSVSSVLGVNIGSFMNMLNAHADVLPADRGPVYALMGNFPVDAINVFPDFLELFLNMGQKFHDSPVAQKWAADQDTATQAKFADIKNEIIRTVLQSGK